MVASDRQSLKLCFLGFFISHANLSLSAAINCQGSIPQLEHSIHLLYPSVKHILLM